MLLTLFVGLAGGLIGGFIVVTPFLIVLDRLLVARGLIPESKGSILNSGVPRILKRKPEKRTPRALTDLMAYQKELQEEGENRG